MIKPGHYTHGLSKSSPGKQSPLYKVWQEMRRRCQKPESRGYKDYGARGIRVYSEWENYAVFYYWAMANGYAPGLTIERKDNDGNYEPSNCTWISKELQRRNNRRVIKITYQGRTQILTDWAKELGIKVTTLYARIKRGYPIETAFQKEAIT